MKDIQPLKFTCKTCGGHGLTVTHISSILDGVYSGNWLEWGPLEAGHLWHYDYKEKIEKEVNEVERGDLGEFAEDDVVEQESDPEGDEFYVNCANCDREIEFGWSQLDRSGLIFPVELSDFHPLEIWPDPKYVEFWQRMGWLRTEHLQVEPTILKILS
jgi:hypothetical protein